MYYYIFITRYVINITFGLLLLLLISCHSRNITIESHRISIKTLLVHIICTHAFQYILLI